jgi:hypothetical protein
MDITIPIRWELTSGHEPQRGLTPKQTDRPTMGRNVAFNFNHITVLKFPQAWLFSLQEHEAITTARW